MRNFSGNLCLMRRKRVCYICNIPCQIFGKRREFLGDHSLRQSCSKPSTDTIAWILSTARYWVCVTGEITSLDTTLTKSNIRHSVSSQGSFIITAIVLRLVLMHCFCTKPRDSNQRNCSHDLESRYAFENSSKYYPLYIFQITVSWNENVLTCQFFKI